VIERAIGLEPERATRQDWGTRTVITDHSRGRQSRGAAAGTGARRPELERSANECGCWRRPCQNGRVPDENYQRPGWFTTNVFNRLVAGLTRLGVSVYGSRVLEVKGRTSGQWRQTPVNLLRYEGAD
jgi:hypothetical protein